MHKRLVVNVSDRLPNRVQGTIYQNCIFVMLLPEHCDIPEGVSDVSDIGDRQHAFLRGLTYSQQALRVAGVERQGPVPRANLVGWRQRDMRLIRQGNDRAMYPLFEPPVKCLLTVAGNDP
ncbi:hypothetical protein Efla_005405 [Eimeria flavescens]